MSETSHQVQVESLVAAFQVLVESDELIGAAAEFLGDANALTESVHASGVAQWVSA